MIKTVTAKPVDIILGSDMLRVEQAGDWLGRNMPNNNKQDPDRWDFFLADDETVAVRFYDPRDAVMFSLAWL